MRNLPLFDSQELDGATIRILDLDQDAPKFWIDLATKTKPGEQGLVESVSLTRNDSFELDVPVDDKVKSAIEKLKAARPEFYSLGCSAAKFVTVNALEKVAKKHKRRRNQSEAYHRRIQKKWDKQAQYTSTPVQLRLSKDFVEKLESLVLADKKFVVKYLPASYAQFKARIDRSH